MAQADSRGERTDSSLLDMVIQTAPDAIITIDETGSILSFSPAAERMFGYSEDEILGRNLKCLMPDPHRARHAAYMARYMATGEKRIIGIGREVRAQRKSGEVFVAELAVGELSRDGRLIFTGFIRDVTDRLVAERRATRLQRMLDRVSRIQMLGEMSTALASEINQPLTAVTSFARAAGRVLAADAPDIEKANAYVDRIASEAQRTAEIVKRMRRLVDRGQADLRPENVNEMVREGVSLSRVGPGHGGFEIHYDLRPDLPDVMADRIQIQQVVINLLRNSVDAVSGETHEDVRVATEMLEPSAVISVRANRSEEDEVMVTIGDGGPGLPEDLVDRMFDPFVGSKESGLGIGLAVCRSIITAHGGRIWAETNGHGGADFHFTLPVAATE